VRAGVRLALTTDDAVDRIERAQRVAGRSARSHAYLDTGMSRMGIPYHRALPWLEALSRRGVTLDGTFMAFTEEPDFDPEQLRRFLDLATAARDRGVELGVLHAASSNGVYHLPEAHLDMVRPGIALFGAYPSYPEQEHALGALRPAVRLRARVVRVERLRPGDSVSYGREFVAQVPTWIATIPAGHTDGVPREAVKGQRVLIGNRLYPAIGAVSASHTIVEVGPEQTVRIGDVATLVGPDRPDIHPNAVAAATGRSVYDILMHLNPGLPKFVVE
jgi:alanine racemase